MKCKECEERARLAREAFLNKEMGKAVVHVAKGAAEILGVKKKTALSESKTVKEQDK